MALDFRFDVGKILTRNPQLGDVLFVERFVKDSMNDFTRESLIGTLRGKLGEYKLNIILDYLEAVNHILWAPDGTLVYIWNPTLMKMVEGRKRY